jgi:hypothetical protein
MTNPTSNFGWQMPTPTDLVTDLPADFEVFGQAVDTSLADLQGGTTGQILAKATNADMDFAWITNDVGDITAVNVTSPITGGGSSGAVTIGINAATTSVVGAVQLSDSTSTTSSVLASTPTATKAAYDLADTASTTATAAIPKSTVTTAGDVIYATGSAAVTRLGIGTAGQVLAVNSGATAPEWKTPATGGKVLQVVAATHSTLAFTSSTSYSDTGLTATITPTLASSKIAVFINLGSLAKESSGGNTGGAVQTKAFRGATEIGFIESGFTGDTSRQDFGSISYAILDTPATTSATTYKAQYASLVSGQQVRVQAGSSVSTIMLMEIGA